jgi:hypothetical protein
MLSARRCRLREIVPRIFPIIWVGFISGTRRRQSTQMIWVPIIWVCATHAMYPCPGHFPARLWVLRTAPFPVGLTADCLLPEVRSQERTWRCTLNSHFDLCSSPLRAQLSVNALTEAHHNRAAAGLGLFASSTCMRAVTNRACRRPWSSARARGSAGRVFRAAMSLSYRRGQILRRRSSPCRLFAPR